MTSLIKRRTALGAFLGTAIAWPFALAAQQNRQKPLVGWLSSRSESESSAVLAAFRQGFAEAGFVENQNVEVIYRWAEGRYDLLPKLASELVDRKVDVIFAAGGPPSASAAKAATSVISVVFIASSPVELGLVAGLARPGGNLTGISLLTVDLVTKQLQYLKELVPQATAFAYLENPHSPAAAITEAAIRNAARHLQIELHVLHAGTEVELIKAFDDYLALRAGGMIVHGEPFLDSKRAQIVSLAQQHAVPGCFPWREYAVLGGLMSYGSSLPNAYHKAALYVARILKGEKPADLPVEQPTKFEMVLNLKTAKTLGLTVPTAVLAGADEVIE